MTNQAALGDRNGELGGRSVIAPLIGSSGSKAVTTPTSFGSMADNALQTVQALLDAAGVEPPAEEVERLARLYPGLRRTVDRFHAIDAGDEVMAAVFRADPTREYGQDREAYGDEVAS